MGVLAMLGAFPLALALLVGAVAIGAVVYALGRRRRAGDGDDDRRGNVYAIEDARQTREDRRGSSSRRR